MFNIEDDRRDYGRLLAPPAGYELEKAVGTTYSLDLEALTLTAISLGFGADTDSMLGRNPISMLNALRKVTDRVVLFYESGHLQIPIDSKSSKLYQLLEKITVPVALPPTHKGGSDYPSFHPKTWLLCYQHIATRQRIYRFVVMSRNLTFDRSWDVVVAFDGERADGPQELSQPIAHFLHFLSRLTGPGSHSKKIVDAMARAVVNVKFDIGDFKDVKFMPIGLKDNGYDIDADQWLGRTKKKFHEVAIMSPFISKDIISRFNDDCRGTSAESSHKRTLITRASELGKLDAESTGNFDLYTVRDEVIDGEGELVEDTTASIRKQDIHAKILMFANGRSSYIYLGSMNASHNGFFRNVEFDVCLWCRGNKMGPSQFLEEIRVDAEHSPFTRRQLAEAAPAESENNAMDLALKRICRSDAHGEVTSAGDETYTVTLHFDPGMITTGLKMTIQPISGKYPETYLAEETKFEGIQLTDITEYYRIYIDDEAGNKDTRIIQIILANIPLERDSKICNSVIDNKSRLYEYIALILSDDKTQAVIESREIFGGESKSQFSHAQTLAIYEKLLEASLHHRERFSEINDIMQMLPEDSDIAAEFRSLYSVFRKALKLKDNE